jgi:hypothetical protein
VGGVTEPLVYTNVGTGGNQEYKNSESKWKPGYIPVNNGGTALADVASTKWVRYRLAGLAVYDAWGNELLTVAGANDAFRVISAGPDGVLAVAPGIDGTLDTDLIGDLRERLPLDARDQDGAKDNLQ